jgi:hypothetical protein
MRQRKNDTDLEKYADRILAGITMAEPELNSGATAPSDEAHEKLDGDFVPQGVVFQVSMRSLLLAMAGLAVLIAAVFAFPPLLSAVLACAMAFCFPAALVSCAIYGNARWRAFAIGMLVPTILRVRGGMLDYDVSFTGSATSWQAYPGTQSGATPIDTSAYLRQIAEAWSQIGHALMAQETMFWLASAVAGFTALAVQKHLPPRPPRITS